MMLVYTAALTTTIWIGIVSWSRMLPCIQES